MQTVLETWQFVKSAERIFSTEEREALIYLIACFSKSERENLTKAEVNEFAKLTAAIKAHYRKMT